MFFALSTLIDGKHRIRLDRLDSRPPAFYRWRDAKAKELWATIKTRSRTVGGILGIHKNNGSEMERTGLMEGEADRSNE